MLRKLTRLNNITYGNRNSFSLRVMTLFIMVKAYELKKLK